MKTFKEIKAALAEIAAVIKELPSQVQEKAYDLLVTSFLEKEKTPTTLTGQDAHTEDESTINIPDKKTRKKANIAKESFQLDKSLTLVGNDKIPSFRTFVEQKSPKSNAHFTVVAIYYLKKYLNIDKINVGHIYTCYKDANRKTPGNLQQNLKDLSSKRYGYIDLRSSEDIGLPTRGETFIEHDLPVKSK